MRWWYFHRRNDGLIKLAQNSFFGERPANARRSENPHDPWYSEHNHIDQDHVHIQAKTYEEAFSLAKNLSLLLLSIDKRP